MTHANVRNNEIIDFNSKYLDDDIIRVETTEEMYQLYLEDKNKIKYSSRTNKIILNSKYEEQKAAEREDQFNKDFFQTSKGWVRRKVNMATGETKDFLSDLLPSITLSVNAGVEVTILVYALPDFTQEITTEYMETLQSAIIADMPFVQECLLQLGNDFKPAN